MHSIQSYIRRLSTEVLEMLLRNHESGIEKQMDEVVDLIKKVLQERKTNEEKHPGSQ